MDRCGLGVDRRGLSVARVANGVVLKSMVNSVVNSVVNSGVNRGVNSGVKKGGNSGVNSGHFPPPPDPIPQLGAFTVP